MTAGRFTLLYFTHEGRNKPGLAFGMMRSGSRENDNEIIELIRDAFHSNSLVFTYSKIVEDADSIVLESTHHGKVVIKNITKETFKELKEAGHPVIKSVGSFKRLKDNGLNDRFHI